MKNIFIVSAILLGSLLLPGTMFAATFDGGETYNLNSSEIVDDNLYIAGGDVTIGGSIQGDLHAVGGMVVVSGDTRDDLMLAGGDISSLGNVTGDARFAGGSILVNSQVSGDIIAAGGSIKTLGNVTVGKDLTLVGGYVVFTGTVEGDAMFIGGEILIDGIINGDVMVNVGEKLTLGENAQINGTLLYKAQTEGMLNTHETSIVLGGVHFEQGHIPTYDKEEVKKGLAAALGILLLIKLIALSVAAIILVLVFKKTSQSIVTKTFKSFWTQVLCGFIFLVIIPIAVLVLLVTIFGSFLGILLLLAYLTVLILSGIYGGIIFGAWTVKLFSKGKEKNLTWWHALMGVVLLFIVGFVPIIGWIIGFIFLLVAIGSFYTMFKEKVWSHR